MTFKINILQWPLTHTSWQRKATELSDLLPDTLGQHQPSDLFTTSPWYLSDYDNPLEKSMCQSHTVTSNQNLCQMHHPMDPTTHIVHTDPAQLHSQVLDQLSIYTVIIAQLRSGHQKS